MNLDLHEFQYRIRTDHQFKRKVKRLVIVGGVVLLLIGGLAIAGLVLFSSAIIGFVFSHASGVAELAFNSVRDYASSFMLEDLNAILGSLASGTNVAEIQTLVNQYFEQLKNNQSIDFQHVQTFITTVKTSLLDSQISNAELEIVRNLILNQ